MSEVLEDGGSGGSSATKSWEGPAKVLDLARHRNGTDTYGIGSRCHILPYFNLDSNADTDTDLSEYEYKITSEFIFLFGYLLK